MGTATKAKPNQIKEIKNKQAGKVKFKGNQTQLKYSLTAISKIEQTGINVAKMDTSELTVTDILTMLWAGLLWKYPNLTVDEVGDQYDMTEIVEIATAVSEAFNASVKK